MTNGSRSPSRRFRLLLGALLPIIGVSVACEVPSPPDVNYVRSGVNTRRSTSGAVTTVRDSNQPLPQVTAKMARVKLNWKDRQQTFDLHLTNAGSKQEIVNAIVYAKNDTTDPPRRAISPPTAFDWFNLANRKDGQLAPEDIELSWKMTGFQSGRGGRLRKTWDVKVEPEATAVVECAHDLDELSPHPKWKGKKLATAPYIEYQVWLFTSDGQCYFQEKFNGQGEPLNPRPVPKKTEEPEPKKSAPPETKPRTAPTPAAEAQAATELKLAEYYLDRNRVQDGKDKLKTIVEKFADTKAAGRAQDLLKHLEK